ncbi:protein 5NUC-like, partial [Sitophilus oryzae]|uniref:Protein 5NUC-like n=1 Tax=Sitophilus oryzae TaxID=7048 RepID=A0A6J2XI75_SITOR
FQAVGNHEFDLTPEVLAKFVDATDAPFVAANLNFTKEPSLSKVQKSVVLQVQGHQVGIIGYLTPETIKISLTGNVVFYDEVEAIREEAKRLVNEGVNIIIALGHSGYEVDKKIAKEVEEVDIVIGGHTNTFLWNGEEPDSETKEDVYPKMITQTSGKTVPVVQAYAYTKYLGVLNVTFDTSGRVTGVSGQPIFLDNSIDQQADVLELLEVYRPAIDELNKEKVGVSKVLLDGNSDVCRQKECNFGNFIADVHVAYVASITTERWTSAPIGIYNGGAIRNTIIPDVDGNSVTRGDLLGAIPFGNQVITLTLSGSNLLYAFEQMVRSEGETSKGEFPQVSGIRLQLDMSKPPYSRVQSVRVRCGICEIPVYETLNEAQNYTLVTSSFLSEGGDGVTVFRDHAIKKTSQDLGDLEMMVWYFNKYSPVYPEVHGRIEFVTSGVRRTNNWTTMLLGIVTLQILWRCI